MQELHRLGDSRIAPCWRLESDQPPGSSWRLEVQRTESGIVIRVSSDTEMAVGRGAWQHGSRVIGSALSPLSRPDIEVKPEGAPFQQVSWTLLNYSAPVQTHVALDWMHLFSRPLNSNTGSRPAHVGFCCQKLPAIFHTLAKQPAATTTTTRLATLCAARSHRRRLLRTGPFVASRRLGGPHE